MSALATSIRQSLSVLCLWVSSIVRLRNLVCVIVECNHVFSLRPSEQKKRISRLLHWLLDLQDIYKGISLFV